ncbi:MAG: restriction endonuclease, partial [Massilibacteroides sp.]|nr:restriction endonuclease [Massilibacteroides sp.]
KYIKTKFVRALLGVLKVTQDNSKSVWRFVPLQDFTSSSDIDWGKPVDDIDRQLYTKYGLTEEEIVFIESMIKPME